MMHMGNTKEDGPCLPNPCQHEGKCKISGNTFNCYCSKPYFGKLCEEDACTNNPCQNGGICKIDKDKANCVCKSPYSGENCEKSPCLPNPCQRQGKCNIAGDSFKCSCRKPYFGKLCEKDSCTNNPCGNGGICKMDKDKAKCECKIPYSGENCELSPCSSSPCKNSGTCEMKRDTFKCDCKSPFFGITCEKECECENGHCALGLSGELKCVCLPEFGLYSAKKCKACECGKGVNCTFQNGVLITTKKCICPAGFKEIKNQCVETTTTTRITTAWRKSTPRQTNPETSTWRSTNNPTSRTTSGNISTRELMTTEATSDYFKSTRDINWTHKSSKFTHVSTSSANYKSTSKVPLTASPNFSSSTSFSTASSPKGTSEMFISTSKFSNLTSPDTPTDMPRNKFPTSAPSTSEKEGVNEMKIALITLSTIILPLILLLIYVTHKYRILKKKSNKSKYFDDTSSAISLQPWR